MELKMLETTITWNACSSAEDIQSAIADIDKGLDLGWDKTAALAPTSNCHHAWMDFALLLTKIYNRTQSPKRFTIIRSREY